MITTDYTNNTVSIVLGNGDGTFQARTSFPTLPLPRSVTLGDLNQDGILDLAAVHYTSNAASLLLGNGDGTFQASTSFQTGSGPYSITFGDLNQDGVLDMITTDSSSNTASVFLAQTKNGTAPLLSFSLKTLADARQALPIFENKLTQLTLQRGTLGAFQSRFNTANNVLQSLKENSTAAAS